MDDGHGKKQPQIVGRYAIYDKIAAGGMATVHLGRLVGPVGFSRTVAIKRLHSHFADQPEFVSMFLDEARLVARIRHPNVVPTLDVVTADGELFVVMEYVQGESLSRLLRAVALKNELMPLRIVSAILSDTLHGLHAAHEAKDEQGAPLGIVHRDVSPQNVLVGVDGAARVLDFGVAKAVHRLQTTRDGQLKGKLAYMAPEQFAHGTAERSADIYAASVVLWEALSACKLFSSNNDRDLIADVLAAEVEPPSAVVFAAHPDIDAEMLDAYRALDAIVLKGLSLDPTQRYATARQMATALEACISPAPRAEVGEWVERMARDVIAERANQVAELESGTSSPHAEASDLLRVIRSSPPSSKPGSLADASTRTDAYVSRPPLVEKARRVTLPRAILAVGVLGATLAASLFAMMHDRSSPLPSPAARVLPSAEPARRVTDWTPPPGTKIEAVASYRAALQALEDGSFDLALQNFDKAKLAEPGLASAYLRHAIMDSMFAQDEVATRESFAKAVQLRPSLGEHDQAMLDAFEPYLQGEPPDEIECAQRLTAAVAKYPSDAELRLYLGLVQFWSGQLEAAEATLGAVSAIDPKLASAAAYRGAAQAYRGDTVAARSTLDRCISGSPSGTDCLYFRVELEEQSGECAKEGADAKLWIARDPQDFYGYQMLAQALAAEGRPLDVVRLAFEQKWSKMYAQNRPAREPLDRARLDLLAGDFGSAEKRIRDAERALGPTETGEAPHANRAMLLADIYRETNRPLLARAVADEYVRRGDVWVATPEVDDSAMSADPLPRMLAAQLHAHELTPEEFDAKRRTWLDGWRKRPSGAYARYLWIYGYAEPAESRDEALTALAALPAYAPIPSFTPQSLGTAAVGKVYWLAGQNDEAIKVLRRATQSCIALMEPVAHTQAELYLGQALEASGDHDGACAAYRVVLDRWGNGTSGSLSAAKAKERTAVMGCAK